MRRPNALMWGAILTLALAGRFVIETSMVNRLPAALAVAGALVPAALVLSLVTLGVRHLKPMPGRDRILASVAGILGFWLASFLVAAVRKTDAPPGTEVLLLTTASWGALLVLGGLFLKSGRSTAAQVVAVLLGVVGAAAVLANWERPSSFSPFVRFPFEEATMLAAGVLWVVATRILAPLVRRNGALRTASTALLSAAAASALAALVTVPRSIPSLATGDVWAFLAPAAFVAGVIAVSWTKALETQPPHVMAAAFLLPASVLSGLSVVEQSTRAFGPVPLLWNAVLWGSAVTVAAVVIVALGGGRPEPGALRQSKVGLGALGLAVLSAATAAASLVRPDILVSVTGTLTSGQAFSTRFTMLGYETLGGWIAIFAACLVLAEVWRVRLLARRMLVWVACICVVLASWYPLHATRLHAWNTWIPFEVQQDYGTEYASRTDVPLDNPFERAALLGTAVAAGLLVFDRVRLRRHAGQVREADREVS